MSILISGMEMPTKENHAILINPQGGIWMLGDITNEDTYLVNAKAISVPSHGRLVVLPEVLYEADTTPGFKGVVKWKVTGMFYYDGAVQSYTVQTETTKAIISSCEIGKTTFLTYEEAEAKLTGGQSDENPT